MRCIGNCLPVLYPTGQIQLSCFVVYFKVIQYAGLICSGINDHAITSMTVFYGDLGRRSVQRSRLLFSWLV